MFSKNFKDTTKARNKTLHNAVQFYTPFSNEKVIEMLSKDGIVKFLGPDRKPTGYEKIYKDDRIQGAPTIAANKDCCGFTKNSKTWYLFPIHKSYLDNVDATEDTLIYWIKYLNETGIGLQFLYLGEQPAREDDHKQWRTGKVDDKNLYYWVGVPNFNHNNANIAYIHWVLLRYLFDTTVTSNYQYAGTNKNCIIKPYKSEAMYGRPYYMIPRIANFFHTEHKVSKLRSLIYAEIADCFSSAHGMFHSFHMGMDNEEDSNYGAKATNLSAWRNLQAPCVNVTRNEVKALLWDNNQIGGLLNNLLTQLNYDYLKQNNGKIPKSLKNLSTPYMGTPGVNSWKKLAHLRELFNNEKYAEYIKTIRESYGTELKATKKDETTKKTVSHN